MNVYIAIKYTSSYQMYLFVDDFSGPAIADIASYKVYGGTSASPTTLLSTISAGTETYTNTSLTNGTTYYYRISAVDNAGNESSKSSDVSTAPKPQKYTVKTDGTGDYTVIQTAINATTAGDTVLVYPGTYVEPNEPYSGSSAGPNLYNKNNLVIMSAGGSGSVVIDLDDHYYGLCFSQSSSNNIIDGFTIKNAHSDRALISTLNSSIDNTFHGRVKRKTFKDVVEFHTRYHLVQFGVI